MDKKNSFLKQIFQLATGAMINLIIGVLTAPVITRLVDPSKYGQLTLFNTYSSIALMIFTLGLDQTFVRYYYVEKKDQYQKKLLDFCFGIPIIFAVVGVVAILFVHSINPNFLGFDNKMIYCFIINIFILILNRFGILVLRLQFKTAMFSAMNILQKALYVIIVIPFAFLLKSYYLYILVSATLISALVSAFVSIIYERRFWFKKIRDYKLTLDKKIEIIKFGLPLMVSSGVFLTFQATDKLCIKHYGTYYDVGVYSSAQSLMSVFSIIQNTFNTLWIPKAIDYYESNPDDRSFYIKMHKIITVIMFVFGSCVLLGKDVFVLLLGEKYRAASTVIPFLMFNPIMYTISETTVTGLYITKHTSSQVIITGVSAVVNLIGNIILIPILGSKGAAISTGLSYIVFFSMRTILSVHYFPVEFKLKKFYLLTAVFALGSWYHMFHSFDIVIVGIFFVMITVICLLYWDTVKYIINVLRQLIQKKPMPGYSDQK